MRLPDLRAAGSASTAIALLARAGWHEIGRGDWSWVYAEQDSELAVRISPWDPAYALHVQQCVDHSGNPYLQRIHHIDALGAVGSAVWMERLLPADEARACMFCLALGIGSASNPKWLAQASTTWPADDAALGQLRSLLAATLAIGAQTLPLWGGSDLQPKNVLMDRRGQLKLVDPFFVRGDDIVAALQQGNAAALAGYRAVELRAFLEIPVFTPGPELDALRRNLSLLAPSLASRRTPGAAPRP